MKPLISVCIPTYNRSAVLSRTLDNLTQQSLDNIEIVVSDNCSSDDTWNILNNYRNLYPENIKIYKNQENYGANYNIIKCLELGNAEFKVLCSDEDDVLINDLKEYLDNLRFQYDIKLVLTNINLNNRFKYKYLDQLYIPGYRTIKLLGFKRYYMTGFIFRCDSIDFPSLYYEFNTPNHGFLNTFPHTSIANELMLKHSVMTTDQVLFSTREMGNPDLTNLDFKGNYHEPEERLSQFKSDLKFLFRNKDLLDFWNLLKILTNRIRITIGYLFSYFRLTGFVVKYHKLKINNKSPTLSCGLKYTHQIVHLVQTSNLLEHKLQFLVIKFLTFIFYALYLFKHSIILKINILR